MQTDTLAKRHGRQIGISQDIPGLPLQAAWIISLPLVCPVSVCETERDRTTEGRAHLSNRVWMCCGQYKSLLCAESRGGSPSPNCTKHNHMLPFLYTRLQSSHLHRHSHIHTQPAKPQLLSSENKILISTHLVLLFHSSQAVCVNSYWPFFEWGRLKCVYRDS